jgi:hypothetical protein
MADYVALKNEILNDPLALGYAGKTDAQVAALINGASRPTTCARTIVRADEVYEAIDATEWAAASAANQQSIKDLLAMGQVNAAGTRTRAVFAAVFAAGTTSRANLLALTSLPVARTRAQEIFGDVVAAGDVFRAKNLT